jgi:hypothetical protein
MELDQIKLILLVSQDRITDNYVYEYIRDFQQQGFATIYICAEICAQRS